MPKIYVTNLIPQNGLKLLRDKAYQVEINESGKALSKDQLKDIFSNYDAVLTSVPDKIDAEIIKSASKNLKIIANYAVGYDNVDVLEANRHNIIVANTPGVASESVAEHVFALILACAKKLIEADKYVRLGKFTRWDPMAFISPQIWGKTIGIIGLGKIGTFVAQIAFGGFRMKILYFDLEKAEDFELITEARQVSIAELLRESDIVTLHCPLTDKTRHLISTSELRSMKKSAILINTARGPVIDEAALIVALKDEVIAAAGLDVYEHEPSVPEELRTMPNVVLTPHSASATSETRETMSRIAAENIISVFEGKEPFGLIKTR